MLAFDVFNECVTDRPTDRPTDTAYYRDARTHLKKVTFISAERNEIIQMTNKNKQKQIDSQRAKEDCHRPVEERNKISARITGQWPIKGT